MTLQRQIEKVAYRNGSSCNAVVFYAKLQSSYQASPLPTDQASPLPADGTFRRSFLFSCRASMVRVIDHPHDIY